MQRKSLFFAIQAFFLIVWISLLAASSSYLSVYVFCAVVAFYHVFEWYRLPISAPSRRDRRVNLVFGAVFSLVVILANYSVFYYDRGPTVAPVLNLFLNVANLACGFAGGTCVGYHVFSLVFEKLPIAIPQSSDKSWSPIAVFLFVFSSIALIDLAYLFLLEYPGSLSVDSIDQIAQMHSGQYINGHPVWHTWLIQAILSVGYFLFSDINKAVALFSVCQLCFGAFCFAYAITTLYQSRIPKWCILVCYLLYALSPYNIALSVTMWKDIPFSLAIFLFITAFYRILKGFGKSRRIDYVLFVLASVLTCLMRTNGILVFALTLLCFVPFLWKRNKKLLLMMAVVLLVAFILCGPFLTACNVQGTDFVETLSLPLQQISRVIVEGHALTPEEEALISRVLDIKEIPELYQGWLADPIKSELREHDTAYLEAHLADYAALWLKLGLRHPMSYFRAWIDQTVGYWNGGYPYYQYAEIVQDNPFGIHKTIRSGLLFRVKFQLFWLVRMHPMFELLNSIGLHVWILLLCLLLNLRHKRFASLLTIPPLLVIAGLLIGTPVAYEFRYAYPVFLSLPLIAPLTLFREASISEKT